MSESTTDPLPVPPDLQAYLDGLAPEPRAAVEAMRDRVVAAIPEPGQRLGYQILGVTCRGKALVYLAGWTEHVAMYPIPALEDEPALAEAIEPYRKGKGTLHFPLAEPLPLDLVERVALTWVAQRGLG
ncbi:DUF1801 domain-containing protein [Actinotalea sp. M2MS4P-6]|uniref:iron chaperone n=1 Tax=Actinotalea sp. M2MS4P-6 TaxID=2983762 RepID=UPI0021E419A8|nr:DUF1801 domain-containing protein [Actinotalea sp. M2MS4P-6]MCV2393171.1 DUF1801 domain-containing protein [Actinotalea sp. M2MS4P-6]